MDLMDLQRFFEVFKRKMQDTQDNVLCIEKELQGALEHFRNTRKKGIVNKSEIPRLKSDLEKEFQEHLKHHRAAGNSASCSKHEIRVENNELVHHLNLLGMDSFLEEIGNKFLVAEGEISCVTEKIVGLQVELQRSWDALTTTEMEFRERSADYEKDRKVIEDIIHELRVQRSLGSQNTKFSRDVEEFKQIRKSLLLVGDQLSQKHVLLKMLNNSYGQLRLIFDEKKKNMEVLKQGVIKNLQSIVLKVVESEVKVNSLRAEAENTNILLERVQNWCESARQETSEQWEVLKKVHSEFTSDSRLSCFVDLYNRLPLLKEKFLKWAHNPQVFSEERPSEEPDGHVLVEPKAQNANIRMSASEVHVGIMERPFDNYEIGEVMSSYGDAKQIVEFSAELPDREQMIDGTNVSLKLDHDKKLMKNEDLSLQTDTGTRDSNDRDKKIAQTTDKEKSFLERKKIFLAGLKETFVKLHLRESSYRVIDERIHKAKVLLEQVQEHASGNLEGQIKQAHTELVAAIETVESIKSFPHSGIVVGGGDNGHGPSEQMVQIALEEEKKQHNSLCLQVEYGESLLAFEKLEVGKLTKEVHALTETLQREVNILKDSHAAAMNNKNEEIKHLRETLQREVNLLNDSHAAAMMNKNEEIKHLREQLHELSMKNVIKNSEEQHGSNCVPDAGQVCEENKDLELKLKKFEDAFNDTQHKLEETSLERDLLRTKLERKLCNVVQLQNENSSLLNEKVALEASAKALQEKLFGFVKRFSEQRIWFARRVLASS